MAKIPYFWPCQVATYETGAMKQKDGSFPQCSQPCPTFLVLVRQLRCQSHSGKQFVSCSLIDLRLRNSSFKVSMAFRLKEERIADNKLCYPLGVHMIFMARKEDLYNSKNLPPGTPFLEVLVN